MHHLISHRRIFVSFRRQPPVRKCQEGRVCPGGYRCYVRRNLCIFSFCQESADCPGDTECVDNKCEGDRCSEDGDCPARMACVSSRCITATDLNLKDRPQGRTCGSHGDCLEFDNKTACVDLARNPQSEEDDAALGSCLRIPCKIDADCPDETRCHRDGSSKYCSAAACQKNADCTGPQVRKSVEFFRA